MSRITLHQDNRFHLVTGEDHMLGSFIQLYDKDMLNETPEGEGLILDWSQVFGFEVNLTGVIGSNALDIAIEYMDDFDFMFSILSNIHLSN